MTIFKYSADELFNWLTEKSDILVLDVRNKKDFNRFKVESPYSFALQNVSYFDFMEIEEESVAKIGRDKPVRIVCAKEGSAKYVAEILEKHGFHDVGYLKGGIKSWGNLLVPVLLAQEKKYKLYQFIRPAKASCSYGLLSNLEMTLFDPSRNDGFYLDFARKRGCTIVKTFETHLQADYIAGSRVISEKTGAEFMANESDFTGTKIIYTKLKNDGEYGFKQNGPSVKCIFTPGHTPGSTSFIIDNRFMICGDTVFIQSIGRPDLGGEVNAWSDHLFTTLQNIREYPDDLLILPGHYMSWDEANPSLAFIATLAEIKKFNSEIFAIKDKKSFLTFIKTNMRAQPEEYATIRLINANLKQVDDEKAEELDLGKNKCAATAYAAMQNSKA